MKLTLRNSDTSCLSTFLVCYCNFANHETKEFFVLTANRTLVGTLITLSDETGTLIGKEPAAIRACGEFQIIFSHWYSVIQESSVIHKIMPIHHNSLFPSSLPSFSVCPASFSSTTALPASAIFRGWVTRPKQCHQAFWVPISMGEGVGVILSGGCKLQIFEKPYQAACFFYISVNQSDDIRTGTTKKFPCSQ